MKHSKIFLGLTAFLLAIAGVTAANHFRGSTTRWYVTDGVGIPQRKHCVATGTISCIYNSAKTTTCLYQNLAVFTSGAKGDATNCIHKFVYTQE